MASPSERIILGIDPGTAVMGFGVLMEEGPQVRLLESGAIRFPAGDDHTLKLRAIFRETMAIIERHHADELAIEAQFFGKNVQSMLKLGRAQGVAIAAALQRELAIQSQCVAQGADWRTLRVEHAGSADAATLVLEDEHGEHRIAAELPYVAPMPGQIGGRSYELRLGVARVRWNERAGSGFVEELE